MHLRVKCSEQSAYEIYAASMCLSVRTLVRALLQLQVVLGVDLSDAPDLRDLEDYSLRNGHLPLCLTAGERRVLCAEAAGMPLASLLRLKLKLSPTNERAVEAALGRRGCAVMGVFRSTDLTKYDALLQREISE